MTIDWEIGKEARELDERPFKERIRIEKGSIKKISIALLCYSFVMIIFYLVL